MIITLCDKCRTKIDDREGIAFIRLDVDAILPEEYHGKDIRRHYEPHLCRACYLDFRDWLGKPALGKGGSRTNSTAAVAGGPDPRETDPAAGQADGT